MSASSNSTAERRWVSAHLYYHGALDDLLRCAVRPLVGELAAGGLIEGFFFVRYWQGGPHVRLRVLLAGQAPAQPVEGMIEARIGQFFARCPSQTLVRSADYLRAAGWFSRHEFGPSGAAVEPLQPNNSLRYLAYVPETDRLGGPAGVAAFEPHFMDSAALALELIATRPDERRRTGAALAMMLLAAAAVIPDLDRLARYFQHSYRSWGARHAGGERTRFARYETGYHQSYDRQRAPLDELARRLVDQARASAGDHLDAAGQRWVSSVRSLRDRLTDQRLAPESVLFQCLHKHNNRLGIRLAEETHLFFLLQRTLTGITEGKDPR
ncbi:MAG: thiopeptide-type bacteriocin biosynthesis protein [Pseudonocardiaceae bacterium]